MAWWIHVIALLPIANPRCQPILMDYNQKFEEVYKSCKLSKHMISTVEIKNCKINFILIHLSSRFYFYRLSISKEKDCLNCCDDINLRNFIVSTRFLQFRSYYLLFIFYRSYCYLLLFFASFAFSARKTIHHDSDRLHLSSTYIRWKNNNFPCLFWII